MKRIHTFLCTGFIVALVMMMPAMASAQLTPANTGLTSAAAGSGLQSSCSGTACLTQIVGGIINAVLGFLGIILLAILIYAGFLWMTAGGDEDRVKRARSTLINAVAGIVIVAASYAIASFVIDQLGSITAGGAGAGGTSGTTTEAPAPGSVANGGACTASEQCSDPLAICEGGVCTDVGAGP